MADPADRCQSGAYAAVLKGPFLRWVHEDDSDFLLEEGEPQENQYASETPLKPRHAPRVLMTAALYEMLCQAYTYVNSIAYRNASGDSGRTREIRTLTLTYPSGMIQEEYQRFKAQARKAVRIFAKTLGKNQRVMPEVNLNIDEASAVHLTYIWSEMRMLGQDPRLWFASLHQDRGVTTDRRRRRGAAGSSGSARAARGRMPHPTRSRGKTRAMASVRTGEPGRALRRLRPTKSALPASTSAAAPPT